MLTSKSLVCAFCDELETGKIWVEPDAKDSDGLGWLLEVDISTQLKRIIEDHTGEIFSWELCGISVVPALETPVDWPLNSKEYARVLSNWPGYSSELSSTCLMRLISFLLTGSAALRCIFTTCWTRSSCSTVVKQHQFQISNGSGAIRS